MRKKVIAGNWKMNKTLKDGLELVNNLKRGLCDIAGADIVVLPPLTLLSEISDLLSDSKIALGAQNVYFEQKGAFTGEVSPVMLKDVGCSYVIIGHSERRKYFCESDEMVNLKLTAAQKSGLIPIVCLGETLEERQADKTFDIIERQLDKGLSGISEEEIRNLIIAYEPVWAIGTGKTATPMQAEEVHKFIRNWLSDKYSKEVADQLKIIYGGSVNPSNAKELMRENDIDGALVGGASLESDSFIEIVRNSL